ncbi:AAA family ATPase [Heliobacterium chlorum]|uniref:AAA family ATPase n=1 Tax=Heliobacterium chlorum TaxID=2698 RepID=A0ABR7T6Z5_HELCL|nr:AAA family ATPase [Heliobacterium chlorum]MBC9786538.1 AAA family ATPase [Heliobacterium chlorum]
MNLLTVNQIESIKKNLILFKVPDMESYIVPNRNLANEPAPIAWYKHRVMENTVIYLQTLSPLPTPIDNVKIDMQEPFVTIDDRNYKGLNTIGYADVDYSERVNWLREKLSNRLILAHPLLNRNNNRYEDEDPYYYNFDIVYISEEKPVATAYRVVPTVVSTLDRKRFEALLQKQSQVQFRHYNGVMPAPQFLICENALYHIPADSIRPHLQNVNSFYCTSPDKITRMEIPYDFTRRSQCSYQGLHFIPTEYGHELELLFQAKGRPLREDFQLVRESVVVQPETVIATKPVQGTPLVAKDQISEYEFLTALKNNMITANLFYNENDLYSFHTALKTNFLTILGGMSGTGKTRLAIEYAKTLGLKSGKDLLIIPISPSYTEPADVLGYLNPQTGYFVESETGLVRFLYNASQNQNKVYMVIFDEMNLSQVEHWFSPFISIMEMDKGDRNLRLFSDRQFCLQEEYRAGISIGDNVIFVGTANLDETTKEFSNRLLDRANVIQLHKQSFLNARFAKEERNEVKKYNTITAVTFRSWIREINNPLVAMEPEELALLDKLHEEMKKVDTQNGVSFRVVRAIASFIENIPFDDNENRLMARSEAFDFQLCQRVFTKVKGHRDMVKEILGTYNSVTDKVEGGELLKAINEHLKAFYGNEDEKIYEQRLFNKSIEFLKQKAKEVAINGYTM